MEKQGIQNLWDQYDLKLTCQLMEGKFILPLIMCRNWLIFGAFIIFSVNLGYLVSPSTAASVSSGCITFFLKDFDFINTGSSCRSFLGIVFHFLSFSLSPFYLLHSLNVVSNFNCPQEGCGPNRCSAKCSNYEILIFSSISAEVCFI